MVIICGDFLIFFQTFHLVEVKLSLVISDKSGIYDLSHELINNSKHKDIRKSKNFRKILKLDEL